MPNVLERQQDILSIISELDISPTMYSNAVEKYKAITAYLESYGIEAEMYPQGSFAFGTVVRARMRIMIWTLSVRSKATGVVTRLVN